MNVVEHSHLLAGNQDERDPGHLGSGDKRMVGQDGQGGQRPEVGYSSLTMALGTAEQRR